MKIKGHSYLIKDDNSGAVINTDWKVYERAKQRKLEAKRLDDLESKINNIESLLERLVEKNG